MHIEVSPPVIAGCAVGAALVLFSVWSISARIRSWASPITELALAEHRIDRVSSLLSNSSAAMSPAEEARLVAELAELRRKLPGLQAAANRQQLKDRLRELKMRSAQVDASIEDAQKTQADPALLLVSRDATLREIQEVTSKLRGHKVA